MKIYENTFIQGRELAKKLAVGTAVSCVAGILLAQMQSNLELIFKVCSFASSIPHPMFLATGISTVNP